MADAQDDLRATAESLADDAKQVQELEEKKLEMDPADPRVVAVSHQVESLVDRMAGKAGIEREISEELQAT
jgi:hypothetical protein